MKNTLLAINFCFIFISFLGCNKVLDESNQTGNIQFSIDNIILNNLKSTSTSAFVLVTIKDVNNNLIYSLQESELYEFEGNYISKPISLNPGEYKLSEFFVLDKNKEIIYASPLDGSKMAQLVDNPLEINFSVNKDATIKLTPEVIKVENKIPENFGYVSFGFNTVETFDFLLSVFTYDTATENFELTDALLSIESPGTGKINTVSLGAETNNITTKDGFGSYILKLTKEGYADYIDTLACDSLKKHFNDPLEIILLENSLKDGLIAYYPFNGNANDESGNDLHGISEGAVISSDRKGIENSAYYFDGVDDFIKVKNNSLLELNDGHKKSLSISLWYNAQYNSNDEFVKNTQDYSIAPIIQRGGGESAVHDYYLFFNNQNSFGWSTGNSVDSVAHMRITNPNFNNWHHIVATIDTDSKIKSIYVDNILIKSNQYFSKATGINRDLFIGSGVLYNFERQYFFKGIIDDIRIYNRVLSQDDIKELYNE